MRNSVARRMPEMKEERKRVENVVLLSCLASADLIFSVAAYGVKKGAQNWNFVRTARAVELGD